MSRSGPMNKSFVISKQLVWEAYQRVKANQGAAGVDGQSVEVFETDLKNNLYRIWNRMSSGTYFPPPVRAVAIPKPHGGGTRLLGVPTVADRIAQTVAALTLEPRTEQVFHRDSYGYRPGRSAYHALAACRERCWKKDWVLDLDIRSFFDSLDHDLVVKAVAANITTDQRWVLLYVKRWLSAPLQLPDGSRQQRDRGTPQGSAVSPVLANLVLHYAFDLFLVREFPTVTFERYADDAVVHCATERQAREVRTALAERLAGLGLQLHPDKTRIVYCKDDRRRGSYEHTSFTFLGYTFQPRGAKTRDGRLNVSFLPAVSTAALVKMSAVVRHWRLHLWTMRSLDELADWLNPVVRGWMNYYGRFRRSALFPLLQRINTYLMRWAGRKYKRLQSYKRFKTWWFGILDRDPDLFAHWRWVRTFAGLR
ncbi:MAG TPA: group II intron reverse transcriptase/maturase [Pseudonocardiaceae bacterium]|nr:group II intron reverse transcriptase/maturase [Pseudonocardiaceae bacterium]